MNDSHAKESEEEEDDEYFDKEVASKVKNASEYFQEMEKKHPAADTGQNSNADGGSIFNQTGGGFLNRVSNNETKNS